MPSVVKKGFVACGFAILFIHRHRHLPQGTPIGLQSLNMYIIVCLVCMTVILLYQNFCFPGGYLKMLVCSLCASVLLAGIRTCSVISKLGVVYCCYFFNYLYCQIVIIKPLTNHSFNFLYIFFVLTFCCHYLQSAQLFFCIFILMSN